jgi:hypothetical protein
MPAQEVRSVVSEKNYANIQEVTLENLLASIKSVSNTNIGLHLMQEIMGGHLSCFLKQPRTFMAVLRVQPRT